MRKITNIIVTAVCALLLVSCGADQAMKKGDKFFAVGEYYDAAEQYLHPDTFERTEDAW